MRFPDILYTEDIHHTLEDFLSVRSYDRVACLCDSNTVKYCFPLLKKDIPLITVDAGETNKTFSTAGQVLGDMLKQGLGRNSLLINLGGGMVSDTGGFCASIYQRGIDYVNIPTTLLAMADAGIGGKTGIDFRHLKNYIGTIYQPEAVMVHVPFLTTLEQAEYRSGWAEVLKHFLVFDAASWHAFRAGENLVYPPDTAAIADTVRQAASLKHSVVQLDPYDRAERKLLNFGHTVGHAIESYMLSAGTPVLHGEAVAAGMICESYISYKINGLPENDFVDIRNRIRAIFPKIRLNPGSLESIASLTASDKKNEAGEIRMVLLRRIGEAAYNIPVPAAVINDSLTQYNNHE